MKKPKINAVFRPLTRKEQVKRATDRMTEAAEAERTMRRKFADAAVQAIAYRTHDTIAVLIDTAVHLVPLAIESHDATVKAIETTFYPKGRN